MEGQEGKGPTACPQQQGPLSLFPFHSQLALWSLGYCGLWPRQWAPQHGSPPRWPKGRACRPGDAELAVLALYGGSAHVGTCGCQPQRNQTRMLVRVRRGQCGSQRPHVCSAQGQQEGVSHYAAVAQVSTPGS